MSKKFCNIFSCAGVVILLVIGAILYKTRARSTPPPNATQSGNIQEDEDAVHQIDAIYKMYLDGSPTEARHALMHIIEIAENSHLRKSVQSHILWLAYARLYVMNARYKHNADSIDLVKIKYWYLRDLECDGLKDVEISNRLDALTNEKVTEIIENWDKHATNGKGPSYLSTLMRYNVGPSTTEP